MEELDVRLARWRRAGLITGSQADSIRTYEASRPRTPPPHGHLPDSGPVPEPPPPPRPVPRQAQPEPPPPGPRPGLPTAAGPRAASAFSLPGTRPEEPLLAGLPFAPEGRTVGLVMAALGVLGVVAGIFSVTVDLLIAPTHNLAGGLEDVLHLGASFVGVAGGVRMAGGWPAGRPVVLASLGINLLATAVLSLHRLTQGGTPLLILLWLGLAVIVAAARFGRPARTAQG